MSAEDFLVQASSRHQVFIQRYAAGQANDAKKLLNRLRLDVLARLSQEPTEFRANRLNALRISLDGIYSDMFGNISDSIKSNALDFATQETEFTGRMIDSVTKEGTDIRLPIYEQLAVALRVKPMVIDGKNILVDGALSDFCKNKSKEIMQLVNDSIVLGDTTPEISKKVSELMGVKQNRQIQSLTRTIINHSSSVARELTYDENSDILDGYEWVSTLDSRTSLVCAGRDGKVYTVKSGPLPPAHFSCRSTTIPVVKDAFTIVRLKGMRPQVGDTTGRTSANTTYGGWLKKQSKGFQDEALGPERASLFRSGKLKIEQFTDEHTGSTIGLDGLRARYPLVFGD